MKKILNNNDTVLRINELRNRYLTDGNIWTIDETVFNENVYAFLVINIKTRALLGYILGHKPVTADYIVELYKTILDNYPFKEQSPLIVHSDLETEYTAPQIQNLFEEENIKISVAVADQHQNQVSEAINDKIKYYTILNLLNENKNTKAYRGLISSQPVEFKGKSNLNKAQSKEYRKWCFSTDYFNKQAFKAIEMAINSYNKKDFTKGITRQEAEYYNTKIAGTSIKELYLLKSSDDLANKIKRLNVESITEAKLKLSNIIQSNVPTDEKIVSIQALLLEKQSVTNDMLIAGFTGVAAQNVEILDANSELKIQVENLQKQIQVLVSELERLRAEKQEKEDRKNARAKRKRLPKRDPITLEIYERLIESVIGADYRSSRVRLAILLLTITGIRINELLPLKVKQLETLVQCSWIAINRSKRGPANHKAFLTYRGKQLIRKRQRDFEIIFAMKEPDAYIFTPESNHYQKLRRETLTKDINKVTREVAKILPNKPNISSHSFRIGFITQLWKDTNDIEFVRQAIGHIKVESTSSYVENLSDEERQKRMLQVEFPEDLILENDEFYLEEESKNRSL